MPILRKVWPSSSACPRSCWRLLGSEWRSECIAAWWMEVSCADVQHMVSERIADKLSLFGSASCNRYPQKKRFEHSYRESHQQGTWKTLVVNKKSSQENRNSFLAPSTSIQSNCTHTHILLTYIHTWMHTWNNAAYQIHLHLHYK